MKQVGVDVGLAIAVLRSLDRDGWGTLVLVAGDGDFFPLAKDLIEHRGVRLIILGAPERPSGLLTCYASMAYPIETVISKISRQPLPVALQGRIASRDPGIPGTVIAVPYCCHTLRADS